MKRFCTLFATVVSVTLIAACGIQEPDSPTDPTDTSTSADDHTVDINVNVNVNDDPSDPVEEPTYLPAPFRLAASEVDGVDGWRFSFSSHYISDAPCGEARGDWMGVLGWGAGDGIALTQGEGGYLYFETGTEFDEEVVMSYIQGTDCGDSTDGWAQYGAVDQLSQMSPEALGWIYCGWADDGDGSNSCNIRLHVTADAVKPLGNMHLHNFNP